MNIYAFLSAQGFPPAWDEDRKAIMFKYQDGTYIISHTGNWISLKRFVSIEYDEYRALDLYKVVNTVNLLIDDSSLALLRCAIVGEQDNIVLFSMVAEPNERFFKYFPAHMRDFKIIAHRFAEV